MELRCVNKTESDEEKSVANVTNCDRMFNMYLQHQKLYSFICLFFGWLVRRFVLEFALSDWPICCFAIFVHATCN